MGTRRLAPRTDGARPAPDRWSTRRGGAAPLAPARLQPWAPETARWSAEVPGAAGGEPDGSAVRTTHDTTSVDPAAEWMTCQVIAVNGGSGLVTGLRTPRVRTLSRESPAQRQQRRDGERQELDALGPQAAIAAHHGADPDVEARTRRRSPPAG